MREEFCYEYSGQCGCRWEMLSVLPSKSVRMWTEDREVGQSAVVVGMNFGVC